MSGEIEALLDCAQAVCASNGARLTQLRRTVLGLVIASPRPAGAYDLLQRLAETDGRGAHPVGPPTVYRALEFLIGAGLIHKVERLSAYVACTRHLRHDHAHPAHDQAIQFLICQRCGRADELEDEDVGAALGAAAARSGFRLTAATIEAEGLCAACDAAGAA